MRMPTILVGLLACVVPAGLAHAAGDQPAGPPVPAPEIAQLKAFQGSVHCTGNQSASPFGPAHPTASVVRGRSELGGFWVTVRYDERKTRQNPTPFHAAYQIGYDPDAKQYLFFAFENTGGHGSATAPGWDGDKIVFTGEYVYPGGKVGGRDTFTRSGDKVVAHLGEFKGSDGNWATIDQETCAR